MRPNKRNLFFLIHAFCLLPIAFVCLITPLAAQKKKDVLLKFSQQDHYLRIVFESGEAFIDKMKVTTSPTLISVEFPEPFDLTLQKDPPFEITLAEKKAEIKLRDKSKVKMFRLSAPSRLVLDIEKETLPETPAETTAEAPRESKPPPARDGKIVIDVGHGGYDFGVTYGDINEKDLNLALARDISAALTKKGKKVFLSRKADQYMSIFDRIQFVNQREPAICISLHASLSKNFVVYEPALEDLDMNEYTVSASQRNFSGKSKLLADSIEKAIRDEFKENCVRRRMPLPLLNSVRAPCVLLEYPSPGLASYDQTMRGKVIKTVVQGIHLSGL